MEAIGEIHSLVEERGRLGARELVATRNAGDKARIDREVALIELAAAFMGDERAGTPSFLYSGWCITALPHNRIPNPDAWVQRNGPISLLVEPGRRALADGGDEFVGVPFGATARLILIYLQTEALKNHDRRVELGSSMRSWFARLGKSVGGRSFKLVREQAERISLCKFSWQGSINGARAIKQQTIVDDALLFQDEADDRQGRLFKEGVTLSERYYESLKEHAVPLEERAVRLISSSSMAIDIYCWLAYRLHSLTAPLNIRWAGLKVQFGQSFNRMDDFKPKFRRALGEALMAYPDAARGGVTETETGLLFLRRDPPVLVKN